MRLESGGMEEVGRWPREGLHSAPDQGCHGDKANTEKSNIQSIGKSIKNDENFECTFDKCISIVDFIQHSYK